MQITNVHEAARELPTGQVVEPGETVEVDDELGASLCEQPANWASATPRSKPKPRRRAKPKPVAAPTAGDATSTDDTVVTPQEG